MDNKKVSVVVCTKNCQDTIGECLKSVIINNPFEVIVIDGKSEDDTLNIAKKYTGTILSDEGRGLSYARQLGADNAKGDCVAYIGSDNVLPVNALNVMLMEMSQFEYAGIQAQVKIMNTYNYWDWGMAQNFDMTHNKVEEREVIGTPCIFNKDIITKIERYDPNITYGADDTDLCLRIRKRGFKLGISTVVAYERRSTNFKDFSKRWQWYGMGDAQFIMKYPSRIIISLTHPLRSYIIRRSVFALKKKNYKVIPFFLCCGLLRYLGIIKGFYRIAIRK